VCSVDCKKYKKEKIIKEEKMEEKIYLEVKKFRQGIGRVIWYVYSAIILGFIAKGLFMWRDYLMARVEEPYSLAKFFLTALPYIVGCIILIFIVYLIINTWLVLKWLAQEED